MKCREQVAVLGEILPIAEGFDVETSAQGPEGRLPPSERMLLENRSGDIFGWSQNAGIGWDPDGLGAKEFLILGTQGGIRAPDGRPIALGYHTGLPCVLVPGGVTLPPVKGEDAGTIQSIGARFAHGLLSLEEASELACHTCATPGGGCQFLGTAATSQVVGEALGMSLPHSALVPSGQEIWLDLGRRSARALSLLESSGIALREILTREAVRNAMAVHAAFEAHGTARREMPDCVGAGTRRDARLVGEVRAARAHARASAATRRRRSGRRHHGPWASPDTRAYQHGDVSPWQPCARRIRDQEHGHRSERG